MRKVMGEATPAPAPAPATPAAPPTPAPTPEDPFLANLVPEEKETYDLAKWAEENVPEFKDRKVSTEFLNFYKAVDAYITSESAKDPNRKFDESDEAFQSFIESKRPDIDSAKWDKLKTDRLVAQVEERTERKLTEKFSRETDAIRQTQLVLEKRPVIEGRLKNFQDNIGKLMTADPNSPLSTIAKTIEKDGLDKAIEADPLFTPLVVQAYNQGERAAAEFLAMSHGVKAYDPKDPNHPVQDWVIRFIRRAGEVFAVKGGDKLVRKEQDGTETTFLPRGKFNDLKQKDPAAAQRHWTFSDEDIVKMLERNTADHIDATVKAEAERLQKAGYTRPAAPAPVPTQQNPGAPAANGSPATAAPPQPIDSPRAGVSAAPGQGGGTVQQQRAMSDAELELLGLKTKAA